MKAARTHALAVSECNPIAGGSVHGSQSSQRTPTLYFHPEIAMKPNALSNAFNVFNRRTVGLASSAAALALLTACAMPAMLDAPAQSVSLLEPVDGAIVATTFKVRFGVKGMAVAPAGAIVADSGHNHLLINQLPVKAGDSVPFDDQHKHFGAGQTEAMITLSPGQYQLTSQFANGAHQSYGAPMSASITVTVK